VSTADRATAEIGQPSGVLFISSLLFAAYLMQARHVPPIATVPFGILMIMVAMWMLAGSTSESGADDMMAGIMLWGFGLGFLFLSITLTAFSDLNSRNRASGIGAANRAATSLLDRAVIGQSTVIAFDTAFNAVALLFVFCRTHAGRRQGRPLPIREDARAHSGAPGTGSASSRHRRAGDTFGGVGRI
jgi:ABC-type uncharacterized transport system permease subunit